MRKVPVLTMVAICGLLALPAQSATLEAVPAPDLLLGTGETGSINLNDFASSTAGDITFSVDAADGTITDGVLEVFGSDSAMQKTVAVSAAAGGEEGSQDIMVQVSSFILGNAPVAGDGGFFNPLVPGASLVGNLTGLPEASDDPSAPAGTGAAALIETVASIDLALTSQGLVSASRALVTDSGLTPSLNADGSYSIEAAADFSGVYMVTLGAAAGEEAAAAQLVVADAAAVSFADGYTVGSTGAGGPQGTVAIDGGTATFTAAQEQGNLLYPSVAVDAGDAVTIMCDYTTTSTEVYIALIAFDGALGGTYAFTNLTGSSLGEEGTIILTVTSLAGAVLPTVQVYNAGAAEATVVISNLLVVNAGPEMDYAFNPNAKAALNGVDGSLTSIAGLGTDILGAGAVAGTQSAENNFAAAGDGSLLLGGAAGLSNAHATAGLAAGAAQAECWVKAVGTPDAAAQTALALVDAGGQYEANTFVATGSLASDSWTKLCASISAGADSTAVLVVQSAAADLLVDDLSIRVIDDPAGAIDLSLLGL